MDNTKLWEAEAQLDMAWGIYRDGESSPLASDMLRQDAEMAAEAVNHVLPISRMDRHAMLDAFHIASNFAEWSVGEPGQDGIDDWEDVMGSVTDQGLRDALIALSYFEGEKTLVAQAIYEAWSSGEGFPVEDHDDEIIHEDKVLSALMSAQITLVDPVDAVSPAYTAALETFWGGLGEESDDPVFEYVTLDDLVTANLAIAACEDVAQEVQTAQRFIADWRHTYSEYL